MRRGDESFHFSSTMESKFSAPLNSIKDRGAEKSCCGVNLVGAGEKGGME